jgi:hypothetical protein
MTKSGNGKKIRTRSEAARCRLHRSKPASGRRHAVAATIGLLSSQGWRLQVAGFGS